MKFNGCLLFLFLGNWVNTGSLTRKLPEAHLQFTLPSEEWDKDNRQLVGDVILYTYKRKPITDSLNRGIVANISVLIEGVEPGLKSADYAKSRRDQVKYKIQRKLTDRKKDFILGSAAGFEGSYKDQAGNTHHILVLYSVLEKKGVQFICDATESIWPQISPEFRKTLRSLVKSPLKP